MKKLNIAIATAIFAASTGFVFAAGSTGEGNATAKQAAAEHKEDSASTRYTQAKKRINADYKADKSQCKSEKGDAQDQCMKEAKARKEKAMADATEANEKAKAESKSEESKAKADKKLSK